MKLQFYLLVLLTLCLGVAAKADSYFVADTILAGVSKEDGSAITELVKSTLRDSNENKIADKPSDAKYILKPRLLKLGAAYVLTIEKIEDGKTKFSSQMKAEKIEEMDNVVGRLVRSVITEVPVKGDARVADVTDNESVKGLQRRETVKRFYIGLGPGGSGKTMSVGTQFNWALGYYWEINPIAAVKVFYDGTSDRFNYLGLGGNYYFSDHDSSPLVTGELGYGSAYRRSVDLAISESTNGFVLGGGVGYQLFRTSKVNLELLVHAGLMLTTNSEGNPSKFGVRLGLYW